MSIAIISKAQEDGIVEAYLSGLSIKNTAIHTDLSERTVILALNRRNISRRKYGDWVAVQLVGGKKPCSVCKELLSPEKFYKDSHSSSGLSHRCKDCSKRKSKEYWDKKPKKQREQLPDGTKRCSKCREVKLMDEFHRTKHKKDGRNSKCKACLSKIHKERAYGVSPEEYERMLSEQDGCCAICLKHFNRLVVDHSHRSGKVRSLLCTKCNMAIGLMGECKKILASAIAYLSTHEAN